MIANELRNKKGAFKSQKIKDLSKDIDKVIKNLYKKHKEKISYDMLHLLIVDSSNFVRIMKIALEV